MKRMMIVLIAGTVLAGSPHPSMGARSCVQNGTITWCNDGTYYQTFGNTTTDNRGNIWRHDRELSIGSDGRVIQRLPGQSFQPDPGQWPPDGNRVFDPVPS